MSDDMITPDPNGNAADGMPFDFAALNPETTEPIADHEPPNAKASKDRRKWWQSKSRKTRERKAKPVPPMPRGGLKPALEQFYTGVGMALMPFDAHCARIIMENAETCAQSLDELAKTNPAMRRALIRLVTGSAIGAVVMAHAPIAMAIMMHHVPALREKREKMVGEFAEMMANMNVNTEGDDNK